MTSATFSRENGMSVCPHLRTDPTFLFPSPPRPPKVIKHGDSTAEDKERVSDGYTARRYDGG